MYQSKLFTLLRSIETSEIHWFQKFLHSPFYSVNEQHRKLFLYVKKYHPELNSPKLKNEVVCRKIFPQDEKPDIQKLRKTMHGLALLVEEFLVAMRMRNNDYQKRRALVSELGDRNEYSLFKKNIKKLIEELESRPYRDTFIYQEIHGLNLEYYGHTETARQKVDLKILKSAIENLDRYYLLQRQQLDFAVEGRKSLFVDNLEIKSLEMIRAESKEEAVFRIYQLIHHAISTSWKDNVYSKIESYFKNNINRLSENDQLIVIHVLLNYLGVQMNNGNKAKRIDIFNLYKFGLEKGVLLKYGRMSGTTFINIVTVGVLEKEFKWVDGFIEKFSPFLAESVRVDASILSKGLLLFHQKDYSGTIDLYLNHVFKQPLQDLNSKTVLLRAYFEKFTLDSSYYDLLIHQSSAFEKFVRRNNLISKNKKGIYLNFIIYTRKIANAHLQGTLSQDLIHKIEKTKAVALKSWLIEKVERGMAKK